MQAPDPTTSMATPRLFTQAFVGLFAASLLFFIAGGVVLPVASRFAKGPLGADTAGVGIAIAAFSIGALALRPVVGWASDRFGRRPLIVLGCVLTVAGLLLHLVANTLPLFVLARAVLGVAEAFFLVAVIAAVSDIAPEARRGEALNYGSLSIYLGVAIGPVIGEATLAATGYTAVWLVALGLAIATTVITVLRVPETAPLADRSSQPAGTRRSRLIHPAGILPGLLILAGTWGMAAFLAFVPLYTTELGMASSGPALAVYALTVIVLRTAFATLPDRIGSVPVAMAALLGSAAGMSILAVARDPLVVYVGTVVFAAGIAFLAPALISVAVSRVDDTERGTVVGTTSAFLDLSFGLAPAIHGAAADSIGFGGAFAVSAVVALAGAALLFARRTAIVRPMATATVEVLAR